MERPAVGEEEDGLGHEREEREFSVCEDGGQGSKLIRRL
jgi:hypothetical protein